VAIEGQAEARPLAAQDADRIGTIDLDLLPYGFEPVGLKPSQNEFRDRLLLSGRARDAGQVAAELRQLPRSICERTFFTAS